MWKIGANCTLLYTFVQTENWECKLRECHANRRDWVVLERDGVWEIDRDRAVMHINKIKKEAENYHTQTWNKTDIELKRKIKGTPFVEGN